MEQSDVFISYRRSDVDFVKQLVQGIKLAEREVWVDWEDIPPGVEGFSDEIQRGIEGSSAFIAVLSPSYLESEYCLAELREALKLKKRIVPVVVHKFDPAPPPEGIGHINWVYFTPHAGQENTFEQSFPKVIQALQADYEHAREHTRLLVRAIEWDKNQRENSYLLKGKEIEQAEGWQVKATGKEPPATELQLDYILNSRKQQRNQQRRITISIGVLLVLAVIAAVYAVFNAIQARISAEIAHSDALASAALQPGNDDIAVSLALEATRSKYAPDGAYNALARVVYPPGGIRYLMTTEEDLTQFLLPAISPEGRYVVIKNRMYDMANGKMILEFKEAPKVTLSGLFLPDGKSVVLAGDRDVEAISPDFIYLGRYDAATGKLLQKFDTGIGVAGVQLSADGKTLVAYQPDAKVTWWNMETSKKMREFPATGYFSTFSSDLKWMAEVHNVNNGLSELVITNTESGDVQQTISNLGAPDTYIGAMRFNNDGKEIAISTSTGSTNELTTFNVETGQALVKFNGTPINIQSIRYSPDGNNLVASGIDQTIVIWQHQSANPISRQTAHRSPLILAEYTQQGNRIVSMDKSGVIMTWDLLPGNLDKRLVTDGSIRILAITPDGLYLIAQQDSSSADTKIVILDSRTLKEVSRLLIKGSPQANSSNDIFTAIQSFYLAKGLGKGLFSYIVYTSTPDGVDVSSSATVASLKSGETVRTFDIPEAGYINSAIISPNGDEVYFVFSDKNNFTHLETWSIATGKRTHSYITPFLSNFQYALNPDGNRLLIATGKYDENTGKALPGSIQMIDTSNQQILFTLGGQVPAPMVFTPDGKQFALLKRSKFGELKSDVAIYETGTGKLIREYTIDAPNGAGFTILPDGKSFVTAFSGGGGGGAGDMTVSGIPLSSYGIALNPSFNQWDWSSGELLWKFPDFAYGSLFSPDGKRMYGMLANSLAVWRFDSHNELVAWACANRYAPEFTPQQRERFNIQSNVSVCKSLQN